MVSHQTSWLFLPLANAAQRHHHILQCTCLGCCTAWSPIKPHGCFYLSQTLLNATTTFCNALAWDVALHGLPSNLMAVFTSRKRCSTPPPHSAMHLLHPDQASKSQFTGHGCALQVFSISNGKQSIPPLV